MDGMDGACRCGALSQHSWWNALLENEEYRVERFDAVNGVAGVMTISILPAQPGGRPFFLTVADLDWPALLTNFAEPVVTRSGEEAAHAVHEMFLAQLRDTMAVDREQITAARLAV